MESIYEINLKRLPKKSNDTNIMKCILRAIHDHYHVDNTLLKVSKAKYEAYYDNLESKKIIQNVSTKYSPEGYSVMDNKLYKTFLNKKSVDVTVKVTTPILEVTASPSK